MFPGRRPKSCIDVLLLAHFDTESLPFAQHVVESAKEGEPCLVRTLRLSTAQASCLSWDSHSTIDDQRKSLLLDAALALFWCIQR